MLKIMAGTVLSQQVQKTIEFVPDYVDIDGNTELAMTLHSLHPNLGSPSNPF